ncbi:FAD-dependent monooxygenase [Amycolatopsis sp. NPDC059021]|uniref:FAD-dependent monooxygenase n=1 Tax=Amycolatopsis sp. NPDC059021 TaxID=3346704 RepID=UPI00366ABB52
MIVVGGGPVGMLLATELGRHGVPTTVVEKLTATHDEPRAGTLHARTAQSLLRRGYLPVPRPPRDPRAVVETPFHFGGRPVLTLESPALEGPPMVGQAQSDIERFFEAKARSLGVTILRGHRVTGVRDDGGHVSVTTDRGELTASYVVGCDGARSIVREAAGITGTTHPATFAGLLGLARLDDEARVPGGWTQGPTGWTLINVNPAGHSRILTHEFTEPLPERDAPATLDDLRAAASRILGHDVPMADPAFLGRFSDFTRLADDYRRGRLLLAGDAAHVHAPLGGQGLNLGLQDALNLGWKLAMVAMGTAPDELLDTYHTERHPVAEAVIENTRAQAALMRPGPEFEPLRALVADLLSTSDANRLLSDRISAQGVRYGDGHGLTGEFLPNFPLGELTVAELLHRGRPVLLLGPGAAGLADTAAGWKDGIDVAGHDEDLGEPAILLRPDGYVAWAGQDAERLAAALTTWFGPR